MPTWFSPIPGMDSIEEFAALSPDLYDASQIDAFIPIAELF
jgi:hypothetical protein